MTTVFKTPSGYRAAGDAIKALPNDPYRVGGYLVRFTSADDPDLTGEYFTRDTEFMIEMYPIKGAPILIEHGLDPVANAMPVGIFDIVKVEEAGIWVEGLLHNREQYLEYLRQINRRKSLGLSDEDLIQRAGIAEQAVLSLAHSGQVQWSSGAFPPQVVEIEDRWIKRWSIGEGSMTVQPAEPDGTNVITTSLKSLHAALPIIEASPTESERHQSEDDVMPGVAKRTSNRKVSSQRANMAAKQITPEQINALVQEIARIATEMLSGGSDPEMEESTQETLAAEAQRMMDEQQKATENASDTQIPEDDQAMQKRLNAMEQKLTELAMQHALSVKNTRQERLRGRASAMLEAAQKSAPISRAGGGFDGDKSKGKQPVTISVAEYQKYRHMTADDMAAGYTMTVMRGMQQGMSPRFAQENARDVLGEEYLRNMTHKAYQMLEAQPLKRDDEQMMLKSVMPYKTNELNASDISGQGLDWVGTFFESQVWERARANLVYEQMRQKGMMEYQVPDGADTTRVMLEGNDPTVYYSQEANSLDVTGRPETVYRPTPFTTSYVDITPKTFRAATSFTRTLTEDSVISIAPQANKQLRRAMEETIESTMINGDTATAASTNINAIDGTPDSANSLTRDAYLAFNGILKSALVTSTTYSRDAGADLLIDDYIELQTLLGVDFDGNEDKMLFLMDFETKQATRRLPELKTRDVAGEDATIFTGKLPELFGVALLSSSKMGKANTAGKVAVTTPANNTRGRIALIYAPYWAVVFKRALTYETSRDPWSEADTVFASVRFEIVRRNAAAVAVSYNVAV